MEYYFVLHELSLTIFWEKGLYLSKIKALNGLSAVSAGGGILVTIALRISVIPIPS